MISRVSFKSFYRTGSMVAQTRRKTATVSVVTDTVHEETVNAQPRSTKRARTTSAIDVTDAVDIVEVASVSSKRKPKKSKQGDVLLSPLRQRASSPWKIGAHVSAAGGVENTIRNAITIGANAFALFVKSQRKWSSPELTKDSVATFKERMLEHGYDPKHILPHGSYLINLGNPDDEKRQKSYDCFLDDLQRCEKLGLLLYNFHPGSSVGQTTTENAITNIAQSINAAHKATSSIITVLENMAGAGNIIGSTFEHLRSIIEQVDNKSRVGVCLDTCHAYSAGYEIKTKGGWNKFMNEFDAKIGLRYLRGMHLNDSKTDFGSHRDRHHNIGLGSLDLQAFHHILTDPRTQDIPLILETPTSENFAVWAEEISVLEELSKKTELDEDEAKKMRERVTNVAGKGDQKKRKLDVNGRGKAKRKRKGQNEDEDDGDIVE